MAFIYLIHEIFADSKDDEPQILEPDLPKKRRLRKSSASEESDGSGEFFDALPQQERQIEEEHQEKKARFFTPATMESFRKQSSGVGCGYCSYH